MHPVLQLPPEEWPEEWREAFEERAAIMQHHGNLGAKMARMKAAGLLRDTYRRRVKQRRERKKQGR